MCTCRRTPRIYSEIDLQLEDKGTYSGVLCARDKHAEMLVLGG